MKDFIITFRNAKKYNWCLLWDEKYQTWHAYGWHRADLEMVLDFRDHSWKVSF